jgi:hypothetical protein
MPLNPHERYYDTMAEHGVGLHSSIGQLPAAIWLRIAPWLSGCGLHTLDIARATQAGCCLIQVRSSRNVARREAP